MNRALQLVAGFGFVILAAGGCNCGGRFDDQYDELCGSLCPLLDGGTVDGGPGGGAASGGPAGGGASGGGASGGGASGGGASGGGTSGGGASGGGASGGRGGGVSGGGASGGRGGGVSGGGSPGGGRAGGSGGGEAMVAGGSAGGMGGGGLFVSAGGMGGGSSVAGGAAGPCLGVGSICGGPGASLFQCCTGLTCNGGAQGACTTGTLTTCKATGVLCTFDEECCSAHCQNNSCADVASRCNVTAMPVCVSATAVCCVVGLVQGSPPVCCRAGM